MIDKTSGAPSAQTHALIVDHTERFPNSADCPFCGSPDVVAWLSHDAAPGTWAVLCQTCEAEGPHRLTKAKAIQAWNIRRSTTDPCRDALEAIRPALRVLRTMCHAEGFWNAAAKAEEMTGWADEALSATHPDVLRRQP